MTIPTRTYRKNLGFFVSLGLLLRVVEVRAASPEDIHELRAFILRAWSQAGPSALGWTGADDTVMREIAAADFLQALITGADTQVRIAEDEGSIVGFAAVRLLSSQIRELAGVIVLETETGKGVGKALVQRVLADARRAESRSLTVKTEAFNERALGFYRRQGFVESHREEETVRGKKIPLVVLECHPTELLA